MEIIFLGSGGGRWVTITQKMKTGGFRIHASKNMHIDPGPGALVGLQESNISPLSTDAVIVSHCHPDHYTDVEVLIEAMTHGMNKQKGVLACSESVLLGRNNLGPAISRYHQSRIKELEILKPGKEFNIYDIKVEALPTRHSDPTAVGLKFYTECGILTYTSDTEYFEGISEHYSGSRIMILNAIRPRSERIPRHLCVDDAIKIIKEVKPELAILNHFGMKMLGIVNAEARRAEKETGVKTISARDGARITMLEERIKC